MAVYVLICMLYITVRFILRDTATGYWLDDRIIAVRFSAGAENFSPRHHVQTGSGAHQASYPVVPGALSLGVKVAVA
jgi:hypothetical protein